MKINKLLAGTLALVLIAGFTSPVFAQINSGEDISIPQDFVPTPATPASSQETLIDFETFPDSTLIPDGARITDQFAPVGVSMFSTDDALGPQILQFGLAGQSGVNTLASIGLPSDFESFIGIEFAGPVSSASVLVLDVGFDGVVLEAFNAADVLVDSDSVTNGPGVGVGEIDTLSVSGTGITRLDIRQVNPADTGDGYAIDDLRFTPELVGGELLPIDSTTLVLAGLQSSAIWMLPVLAGAVGVGAYYIKTRMNKE